MRYDSATPNGYSPIRQFDGSVSPESVGQRTEPCKKGRPCEKRIARSALKTWTDSFFGSGWDPLRIFLRSVPPDQHPDLKRLQAEATERDRFAVFIAGDRGSERSVMQIDEEDCVPVLPAPDRRTHCGIGAGENRPRACRLQQSRKQVALIRQSGIPSGAEEEQLSVASPAPDPVKALSGRIGQDDAVARQRGQDPVLRLELKAGVTIFTPVSI